MIAMSIFMKVIYRMKVPNMKMAHSIMLLRVPLSPKFSKSNSPRESKYICINEFQKSSSKGFEKMSGIVPSSS